MGAGVARDRPHRTRLAHFELAGTAVAPGADDANPHDPLSAEPALLLLGERRDVPPLGLRPVHRAQRYYRARHIASQPHASQDRSEAADQVAANRNLVGHRRLHRHDLRNFPSAGLPVPPAPSRHRWHAVLARGRQGRLRRLDERPPSASTSRLSSRTGRTCCVWPAQCRSGPLASPSMRSAIGMHSTGRNPSSRRGGPAQRSRTTISPTSPRSSGAISTSSGT